MPKFLLATIRSVMPFVEGMGHALDWAGVRGSSIDARSDGLRADGRAIARDLSALDTDFRRAGHRVAL